MSKWEKVKLGDICTVVSGTTPKSNIPEYWNGNYNWVTPAEITDNTVFVNETQRKITDAAIASTSLKAFPSGTVLLSSRAPIGKVAIAGTEMYCNQGFKNLICSKKIYNKYLFWFLKSKSNYLNSLGRGATFKEISKPLVEKVEVPLPPLEEQHKIASILDTVSEALKLRKQQLNELDLLVKSKFIEMFGDPVINRKSWKTVALNKIGVIKSGGTPKREHTEYFNGSIPWITTIALGPNIINISNAVEYITQEAIDNSATKIIPSNSLLLGMRVGVGKTSINAVPMCTNQDIIAITKINQNLFNLLYLKKVVDMYSGYFNYQKRGATIKGINNRILKAVLVPITPIKLQNKFASFVKHVDKLKSEVQKSIDQLQILFDSLMQQYFE